jgi:hypothetical protein
MVGPGPSRRRALGRRSPNRSRIQPPMDRAYGGELQERVRLPGGGHHHRNERVDRRGPNSAVMSRPAGGSRGESNPRAHEICRREAWEPGRPAR